MSNYLIEADAWTGLGVETLRFATIGVTTRPTDTPANAHYAPRVLDSGGISRSIRDGASSVSYGGLELANADGRLDHLIGYGFDGRRVLIRDMRDPAASITKAPIVFQGVLEGLDSDNAYRTLRLKIRDRLTDLDRDLLTEKYAGTTIAGGATAEGTEDLRDTIKPRVWGRVLMMQPVPVNPFDLVYQVSAARVSKIEVFDGGLPLTLKGDHPTIAALVAAEIAPGEYATCRLLGLFRLGGKPVLTITAAVTEGATVADRSTARVVQRILEHFGIPVADRVQATFDALHAYNPAEIGILVGSGATALSVVSQILESVGAALVPDLFDRLTVAFAAEPSGDPILAIGRKNIIGDVAIVGGGENTPAWKVTLDHGRLYRTLSGNDLAGRVREEDPERADFLAKETRQAVAENATIKIAHPKAREVETETFFVNREDAEARAAAILALEGVKHLHLQIAVTEHPARPVTLGSVVSLDLPRFGLSRGKLFRVIGRQDDFRNRNTVLDIWR